MAQDALLKAIEDDALAEKEAILKEAEDASVAIIEQARTEASAWKDERMSALRLSFAARRAVLTGSAKVRSQALKLKARHALIQEVLREAVNSFGEQGGFDGLLNRFYAELKVEWDLAGLPSPVVLVNPADAGLITAEGVEVKTDKDVRLGVVFVSKDGKTRYENTVDSRLKKALKTLEPEIDRLLFRR